VHFHRWIVAAALTLGMAAFATAANFAAEKFTVEKDDEGVTVNLDGKLFTKYLVRTGKKPALWPVIGPTGKAMTRPWPMDKSAVEAAPRSSVTAASDAKGSGKPLTNDHPHHRSIWFGHQKVNDANVWLESGAGNVGSQQQRQLREASGGERAKIVTVNDWLDKDGKKLCEDERTVTCSVDGDNRIIDYDVVVKATAGDVTFGDDKDGLFGIRVPDSMRVDAKQGGTFINSKGGVDEKDAWGKTADWIDYHGPVDGEVLGIAILNHPSSYGYPTHWHTRNYGLFAANPFGLHEFEPQAGVDGTHTVKAGDSLVFRYRIIFHKGDEKLGRIAEAWAVYSKLP
jgi:Family of unknown function (DUF6807)